MQTSTFVVLACLIAVVVARTTYENSPIGAVEAVHEASYDSPAHERSPRTKRGLLLLKKKLLLACGTYDRPYLDIVGALGLKAAKVGAIGAVGALALKSKPRKAPSTSFVEIHAW